MKKLSTDSKYFGVLKQFAQFAESRDLSLTDNACNDDFIKELAAVLKQHRDNPIMVHGFRIESMFAYLAAALGGCQIITEEDSGDLFAESEAIKRPDFRILTHEGREIFVEVKNFHESDSQAEFSLKRYYAESVQNYADAFGKPLLFAIFWVRWHTWTLTPLSAFSANANTYSLSLGDGMKNDHKAILGDCFIGIPKPLILRFFTDPTKPRRVDSSGHTEFTIGRVAFFAGGFEVVDDSERKLAWFFLRCGNWEDIEQSGCVENGELISLDLQGLREDPNPNQGFQIVGQLSQMITREFNSLTVEDEAIRFLSPKVEPG